MSENQEVNITKKEIVKDWWQPALVTFGRFSSWIVGPVILGVIIGNWLEKKYGSNWYFLASVLGAFVLSIIGLIKEARKEYKKTEKIQNAKIKNQNDNVKLKMN